MLGIERLEKEKPCNAGLFKKICTGVNDGARTRDNQNHNLGLYQLSYVHHRSKILSCLRVWRDPETAFLL
jgi:hypothetical protein